jgi:hypothetical protein
METPKKVTAKDWRKTGFVDGRNGNPRWLPKGNREARDEYLAGYQEGKEELKLSE